VMSSLRKMVLRITLRQPKRFKKERPYLSHSWGSKDLRKRLDLQGEEVSIGLGPKEKEKGKVRRKKAFTILFCKGVAMEWGKVTIPDWLRG